MKNESTVSIHIVTYNQVGYIADTIESALAQDYPYVEIVIADDGSTDGTDKVIMDYAKSYPDIIVPLVGGENLGITGNSNRALEMCKGDYIAFQGGDDLFVEGKISAQVQWMEDDNNRVLCGHEVEVFYDDPDIPAHKQGRNLYSGSGPVRFIRDGVPFQGTSIMIRSDAIPEGGFNSRLRTYSDDLFFIDVVSGGGCYGYVDGAYAKYRRHSNNVSKHLLPIYDEWELMFTMLKDRYPNLKSDIDFGFASRVEYPRGVYFTVNSEYKESMSNFLRVLKVTPFSIRTYVRILQCLLSWTGSLLNKKID